MSKTTFEQLCEAVQRRGYTESKQYFGSHTKLTEGARAVYINFFEKSYGISVLYGVTFYDTLHGEWYLANGIGTGADGICNQTKLLPNDNIMLRLEEIETELTDLLALTDGEIHAEADRRTEVFYQTVSEIITPVFGEQTEPNLWQLQRGDYSLRFRLYPSVFSGNIFLDVQLCPNGADQNDLNVCCYTSLRPEEESAMVCQLTDLNRLRRSLSDFVTEIAEPFSRMEFDFLGKSALVQKACLCSRQRCEHCWVCGNFADHEVERNLQFPEL